MSEDIDKTSKRVGVVETDLVDTKVKVEEIDQKVSVKYYILHSFLTKLMN